MGVEMPQYSEKKRKMYEAAEQYYSAIKQGKTQEDIERLGEQLHRLEAEYSDNPAYLALMLMCHKVTHKNLIDSSPLFRYCLTHASCNFFVKTIDSDTSKEI